jgi:hypothetical protein
MNCLTLMLQSFERITANQLRASRRVSASKKVRVRMKVSPPKPSNRAQPNSCALPGDFLWL